MTRQSLVDSALQEVSDAIGIELLREHMPQEHDYELDLHSPQHLREKIEKRERHPMLL
jgi:hypothetical protein